MNPSGYRLSDWGYHLNPGRYSLQAVLRPSSVMTADPSVTDAGTSAPASESAAPIKSNIVTVLID